MQAGGTDRNRLRRAAIWAPFLKAIPCFALAGYSIWELTKPMDALVGMFALFVTASVLCGGVGYLLAAFLLSPPSFPVRFFRGVILAAAPAPPPAVLFFLAPTTHSE